MYPQIIEFEKSDISSWAKKLVVLGHLWHFSQLSMPLKIRYVVSYGVLKFLFDFELNTILDIFFTMVNNSKGSGL